ncbi:MAG: ABC transporter permease [Clostridia bacterium]|nr:ABC transporter permease [Clostridia bacterium]
MSSSNSPAKSCATERREAFMIAHLLQYRLKCFLKDRQMLFWTLAFPLLLATLFNLAFANLSSIDTFFQIPVAIVDNDAYRQNAPLQSALAAVSGQTSENSLFELTLTTEAHARELMDQNLVEGIILLDPDLHLLVKKSGLPATILKSFLDDYKQTDQAIHDILESNPDLVHEQLLPMVAARLDYLAVQPISKHDLNSTVIYFYALMAMTALYGGFWGLRIVNENQANLSTLGARVSVAPVHKLVRLLVDIGAALMIQFAIILLVIAYIQLILGYSFGTGLGWILLAAGTACFMGIAYGACIGAIVPTGEGIKTGILIGSTMIMTFLSGMMYQGVKYAVTQTVPALAWLNPANLITDAFLALYYDGASPRYFLNVGLLLAFGLIFSLLAFATLRRQRYASL